MKSKSSLFLLLWLLLAFTANGNAQEKSSAAELAQKLKAQLLDVQIKEKALRVREVQLQENLKPENIERSLAGVGSTRPEELRELRRRELTIERDTVRAQLTLLETSRVRLEAAIADAEVRAYQQSARPETEMLSSSGMSIYQLLLMGGAGLGALTLGGGAVMYKRRRRRRSG